MDIDFRDVLLAIGSRMYRAYRKSGGEIPDQLMKQLNSWRGKVEQEVKSVLSGQSSYELGTSIDAFFINAGMKMKLEPKTRIELRQIGVRDEAATPGGVRARRRDLRSAGARGSMAAGWPD